MATLDVKINTTQLLRDLHVAMNQVMIVQLAELLHVDTDTALDWLICKVSQFRAVSEDTIQQELDAIDKKVMNRNTTLYTDGSGTTATRPGSS